jgi:hypothetical protein
VFEGEFFENIEKLVNFPHIKKLKQYYEEDKLMKKIRQIKYIEKK